MKFEKEILILEKHKSLNTYEDVQEFEKAIGMICDYKDPDCIGILMGFLDDDCPYPEVMYTIIHGIESFEIEVYVNQVIFNMEKAWDLSPEFCSNLLGRILNHSKAFEVLKNEIVKNEKNPQIYHVTKKLMENSIYHKGKCEELMDMIKN